MSEVEVVPRGLLVDWGGVLTSGLEEALRRWAELDGFDFDSYLRAVLAWLPAESPENATAEAELNPVHALERGQIAVPDFERKLASILVRRDGTPVPAEGLIERMFAHFEHQPAMSALVRRARSHGIRTALLSNSWGNTYPRDTWDGMFDDVVISGEVVDEHTLLGLQLKPAGGEQKDLRLGLAHPDLAGDHDVVEHAVPGVARVGVAPGVRQ